MSTQRRRADTVIITVLTLATIFFWLIVGFQYSFTGKFSTVFVGLAILLTIISSLDAFGYFLGNGSAKSPPQ